MGKSPENEHPQKAFGWAARDDGGLLSPFHFSRRATGVNDVKIKILFCGICHSDLHFIQNGWGMSKYPIVPGHEIVGIATEVGANVKKFKVGERVGVGCLVGSCRACQHCKAHEENYCSKLTFTYNSTDRDGTITYGGYSSMIVVDENFVVRIPEQLPMDAGAPLLCAGITVYSPLKYYGLDKPGIHLGVVGLGGLGHVAVKFAKAMGVKVTVISTSPSKKEEALAHLGADSFIVSTDPSQLEVASGTMDGILDTVSAPHDIMPSLGLLKTNGKFVLVGLPEKPLELHAFPLLLGRKMVAGSLIGGMEETQEMLNFAAEHQIMAEVEIVPISYLNTAMERLAKGNVKYRFVIDIGNTLKDA